MHLLIQLFAVELRDISNETVLACRHIPERLFRET